ncbi:hypothetical protein [Marispirochaeta sp.]|jgi:hypothetical protein|uniref:hypothetical protein n=1 Tax=Marispirochaeta sp. TaxID=2038653 RepID=UPI0029C82F18|nr:hypothetical protein [Marispirochaeta sp.]
MEYDMISDKIYSCFSAVREQYMSCFDQTWFRILLEECPMEKGLQGEIRVFLDSQQSELERSELVLYGVSNLEHFIRLIEAYLLPNIKELLGVSGLRPDRRLKNREQYLHHRLLAEVLPYNVSVLKSRVQELKEAAGTRTPPELPEIPVYRSA